MEKDSIQAYILDHSSTFNSMSDSIWGYAELQYQENASSALQIDLLKKEGFRITSPVADIRTAFFAEYGEGTPVIAVLGEYDALPGLSQEANVSHKKPVVEGAAGHGCCHNLLGTAAVEAAAALKHWLMKNGIGGTVRYYGCPAEEGGAGKIRMLDAGAFADVDIALSWHPAAQNYVMNGSTGIKSFSYSFHGVTSHAASSPHLGRSALDAAELMNVGANFLREHVPAGVSIQYAFLDAGTPRNNIIPDYAAVSYSIRATNKADIEFTFERIQEIAKGAALMAGVRAEGPKINMNYQSVKPNWVLMELLKKNADCMGAIPYTDADRAVAGEYTKAVPVLRTNAIHFDLLKASTDFGDVTNIVPGAAFCVACIANGTALHNWSATAQGKTDYAHKGMHRAAEIMAATAADLFLSPELVAKAKEEFAGG